MSIHDLPISEQVLAVLQAIYAEYREINARLDALENKVDAVGHFSVALFKVMNGDELPDEEAN